MILILKILFSLYGVSKHDCRDICWYVRKALCKLPLTKNFPQNKGEFIIHPIQRCLLTVRKYNFKKGKIIQIEKKKQIFHSCILLKCKYFYQYDKYIFLLFA